MDPLKSVRSLDPAKRAFSLFDDFKAFALKGNVIDLAIGVIIGTAFGKMPNVFISYTEHARKLEIGNGKTPRATQRYQDVEPSI